MSLCLRGPPRSWCAWSGSRRGPRGGRCRRRPRWRAFLLPSVSYGLCTRLWIVRTSRTPSYDVDCLGVLDEGREIGDLALFALSFHAPELCIHVSYCCNLHLLKRH